MSGERLKPVLVGGQELAAVYGAPARNVAQWLQRGALDYSEAVIVSGKPYWTLQFAVVLGEKFARPKDPDMAVVEELRQAQAPRRSLVSALAVHRADLPPIVGKQEITAVIGEINDSGLSRVDKAVRAGTFPESDWYLSGAPLWLLDSALAGVEGMREVARTKPPVVDVEVVESLRAGVYDGPGSAVLSKGPRKKS
ncbi:hypothetical protein ACIQ9P_03775 [Kitasatospora sp. NPDC094019]|uniref:hypothetical protein n=1 Tax=Kitasatospora sp. NPDC094019 TaxID=3364091 RepID=UPI00381AAA6A